jgi:hypothetical protein
LHCPGYARAISPNLFKVNSRSHNIDIVERELRALREYLAIAENHGTPVKIQPFAIATWKCQILESRLVEGTLSRGEQTYDIGVYVYTSALARSFTDELQPNVQFLQTEMASRTVGDDFNAVQAHRNI